MKQGEQVTERRLVRPIFPLSRSKLHFVRLNVYDSIHLLTTSAFRVTLTVIAGYVGGTRGCVQTSYLDVSRITLQLFERLHDF